MNYIDILDLTLSEKYWNWENGRSHYSHHLHAHSPYETDDSCGNCNGALCDICRIIVDKPHLEVGIPVNELQNMMEIKGCPKENAINIAVSDYSLRDGDWKLKMPNHYNLEERYPEFYKKVFNIDNDIWDIIFSNIDEDEYKCYDDFRTKASTLFDYDDKSEEDYHLKNQFKIIFSSMQEARVAGESFTDLCNRFIKVMKLKKSYNNNIGYGEFIINLKNSR